MYNLRRLDAWGLTVLLLTVYIGFGKWLIEQGIKYCPTDLPAGEACGWWFSSTAWFLAAGLFVAIGLFMSWDKVNYYEKDE